MLTPLRDPQSWLDLVAGLVDFPFAIVAFVVAVVWWSVALGGITYGFWEWSLPLGGQPGPLAARPGHSATARIWTNEVIGVVFLLTLPIAIRGAALLRAHRPSAAVRRRRDAPADRRPGGAEQAAASAEATALRRLERDIHDGPQQRLVRLAMDLGRAKQQLDTDPEAARATIDEALGQTRETLDELRALSRGIAPPILTDRGLASRAGRAGRAQPGAGGPGGRRRTSGGSPPAVETHRLLRGRRGADQRGQAPRRQAVHGHRGARAPACSAS